MRNIGCREGESEASVNATSWLMGACLSERPTFDSPSRDGQVCETSHEHGPTICDIIVDGNMISSAPSTGWGHVFGKVHERVSDIMNHAKSIDIHMDAYVKRLLGLTTTDVGARRRRGARAASGRWAAATGAQPGSGVPSRQRQAWTLEIYCTLAGRVVCLPWRVAKWAPL